MAWLILQVAAILFPAFDVPPWALRLVFFMHAWGFPLVVVIAWAFARSPGRSDYILEKRYCQSLITGDLETFQNTMRRYPPCPSLKAANRPHGDTGA